MEESNIRVVYVEDNRNKGNGMGTAGFVLSLVSVVFCWLPILAWITWFLGFLFSFIGVFKKPRGLAIAGLVLSVIGIIILIIFIGAIVALAATS